MVGYGGDVTEFALAPPPPPGAEGVRDEYCDETRTRDRKEGRTV